MSHLFDETAPPSARTDFRADFRKVVSGEAGLDEEPGSSAVRWRLTPLQQATLVRTIRQPEAGFFVQQLCIEPKGVTRLGLTRIWSLLGAHFDALRLVFEQRGTQLFQYVRDEIAPLPLFFESEASLEEFLSQDRKRGFEPFGVPPWRFTILTTSRGTSSWVWTFHHAILDGRSHRLILAAFRSLLGGSDHDDSGGLSELRPFTEYLGWRHRRDLGSERAYWVRAMADWPGTVGLPTLVEQNGGDDGPEEHGTVSLVLDTGLSKRLTEVSTRFEVTLHNLFQGVWALALGRYHDVSEVTFGSVRNGRHWGGHDATMQAGMLINTVPFRVNLDPRMALGSWLRSLRQQQLMLRDAELSDSAQIREWAEIEDVRSLFETVVAFESRSEGGNPGLRAELHEMPDGLVFSVDESEGIELEINYPVALHPRKQIELVLSHLETLLRSLCEAGPDTAIGSLPMMTDRERKLILGSWQGPIVDAPWQSPARLLERVAAENPHKVALEAGSVSLTYLELHQQANRLARLILKRAPDATRAFVLLDRRAEQPITWLALLKAGIAYAACDHTAPVSRVELMVEDLDPSLVITESAFTKLSCFEGRMLVVVDDMFFMADCNLESAASLEVDPDPDAPSYLCYTSGTTGSPKASVNTQRGLANLILHLPKHIPLDSSTRCLAVSSASFDASVSDLIIGLTSGGTLVYPDNHSLSSHRLAATLANNRITTTLLTPHKLAQLDLAECRDLGCLLSGGEALSRDQAARLAKDRRLFNLYGPSECSIISSGEEWKASPSRPTIGRPLTNVRAYILDEKLELLPVGVPGELHLGGVGVASGYWRRGELTKRCFIDDPFAPMLGSKMYRTGDLARWLSDGRIEFLGRRDRQVKHSGYRVELEEIESHLRSHEQIRDAVVAVHKDSIAAWLVADSIQPSEQQLRGWLLERLQPPLVPESFIFVDDFPHTLSGKLDHNALMAGFKASNPADAAAAHLQRVNRTGTKFDLQRTVVDLVDQKIRETPDAVAIEGLEGTLSYSELGEQADVIASEILGRGLAREDIVVVMIPPGRRYVTLLLAILKAGGSYLPVSPNTPKRRFATIATDSRARFVVRETPGDALPSGCRELKPEELWGSSSAGPAGPKPHPPEPGQRAYVIYTSGSSGRPKGVEVEHRNLTNLVLHYHDALEFTAAERGPMLASPDFDASVADLWPILCCGGAVLIPPADIKGDVPELVRWLHDTRATFAFLPPILAEAALRIWPKITAMRNLAIGGEVMHRPPPPGLPFTVYNTYGPTENTVDSTWAVVSADSGNRPPIGRPISNVRAYVLDREMRPVPKGRSGELYLGGANVARGYLDDPHLTRARFFADPFSGFRDGRMYRTGDRVRWNEDDQLVFEGRIDHQVQIMGVRIELGEIEALLKEYAKVEQACCVAIHRRDHPTSIVAHVQTSDHVTHTELETHLRQHLRAEAIPTSFQFHEALPLNASGKIDRKFLHRRALEWNAARLPVSRDTVEQRIRDLWAGCFPDADPDLDERFAALGGDSLGAELLLLAIEEETGIQIPLPVFLLRPTLSGLVDCAKARGCRSRDGYHVLRQGGDLHPLICLHTICGGVDAYRSMADALPSGRPVHAISSLGADQLSLPKTLDGAARKIVKLLLERFPDGGFHLAGYSWSGCLAFEVSRQLWMKESRYHRLILIDADCPFRPGWIARAIHFLRHLPSWGYGTFRNRELLRARLSRRRSMAANMRNSFAQAVDATSDMPDWLKSEVGKHYLQLARAHTFEGRHPVSALICRARINASGEALRRHPLRPLEGRADCGWSFLLRHRPVINVFDCNHNNILQAPKIDEVAAEIDNFLRS